MSSRPLFCRAVLIAGLLALGLSACGRRGALEPPPNASATQAQTEEQTTTNPDAALPSPVGTPSRSRASRGYAIPNKPFILDPLL